ncbi:11676_t:CDS:2, partial [Diversispora eburnea]
MSCLSTHLVTASDKKTLTDDYYKWHNKLSGLPSPLTDEIRSSLYKRYKKKTGLDPWIKSETPEKTDNHLSQDCVIKISKFPEEKKAKCPICKEKVIIAIQSLLEIQVSVPNKTRFYQPEASLRQYAIEHGMDPKKFSVITEAEKNRWVGGCFRGDLERDIRYYQGGIKRKEDPRKYHKFLTDQERLV